MEVDLFWVVVEGLETVADDLEDVEPEDLEDVELEEERDELEEEPDLEEDDEDLVEPLWEVEVVDLRVCASI